MKLQNVTSAHGKWYDDACGTAYALEVIGERWSLLIVRELLLGPRRFRDVRAGLPRISAKTLTERLDGLEKAGVLFRKQLPTPASVQVYELTAWGYLAEEPIKALGAWAAASAGHDHTLPLSAASLMISFRTMFDAASARSHALEGAIRIGEEDFRVVIKDGRLVAERGDLDMPDFIIRAPEAALIAAGVYGKVAFGELAGAGVEVTGDAGSVQAFVDCFHLPPKVG